MLLSCGQTAVCVYIFVPGRGSIIVCFSSDHVTISSISTPATTKLHVSCDLLTYLWCYFAVLTHDENPAWETINVISKRYAGKGFLDNFKGTNATNYGKSTCHLLYFFLPLACYSRPLLCVVIIYIFMECSRRLFFLAADRTL